MPLYDFKCDDCGAFEKWMRIAELEQLTVCPSCEQPARRVFSPPMVITSGTLRVSSNPSPRLVERSQAPPPVPRNQAASGRPWMISH